MSFFIFAKTRRFAPLFGTQFLGAFNDNLFKTTLFVLISFYGLGKNPLLPPSQMLNVGALLFVLPYFLFSAVAGQLATRFNKARLAQVSKIMEIVVMVAAGWGFMIGSAWILLACLFVMGTQSTLFGPVKYAVLPEYLDEKELVMGNGLIESGTFIAILCGQIIGTVIAGLGTGILAATVVGVAVAGLMCSLFMPSVVPHDPKLQIDFRCWKSTRLLLQDTFAHNELATAIIGISWFWFVGAIYTTQLPMFVRLHLGGNDHVFNLMLALFSIGIAMGSVWCARLSKQHLRLGLVLVGSFGLTVCGTLLLWAVPAKVTNGVELVGLFDFLTQIYAYPVMLLITAIGVFGGFFSVPLYTWLQMASTNEFRAHAVAANNIVNGIFMVASALFSVVLLMLFNNIVLLYVIVALGNIPITIYLIKRVPSIVRQN